MQVQDSMSRFVVCLGLFDSIEEAYVLMNKLNCRHLPVIDQYKLLGILSDRDILLHANVQQDGSVTFPKKSASEIMTKEVVTIYKDAEVGQAVELMLNHQIDCLPITGDDGELVGITTSSDLLELLRNQAPPLVEQKLPWEYNLLNLEEYRASL